MVIIWIALTAVGEVLVLVSAPLLFPPVAAAEGKIVDDAFRTLMILAAPVFAFVVAMMIYSIPRFRRRGVPTQDGPPLRTHGPFVAIWVLVTTALTIFMIIHPGITGMNELRAEAKEKTDLVVQVEGFRWAWRMTYPQHKVTTQQELVLPVGAHVRFEVSSTDILHAFWVPAFRMKIDAVPGMVTTVYATPNKVGTFAADPGLRLQCAELCGLLHDKMVVPVRVVDPRQFEAWLAQQAQAK
ncbi:MAG: cytochrome c oxidase subunit II [Chloroflexi bacterium]|nr:cytochrome c oxidase subunit II [Chloroflexota bacterium]